MTAWLLSFGWNWLLVPVGFWFLRGLWRAVSKPRIKYRSHTKVGKSGHLLDVYRQELLPPWRNLEETWYVNLTEWHSDSPCVREGDGKQVAWLDMDDLHIRLRGCLKVAILREKETEEILGEDRPN